MSFPRCPLLYQLNTRLRLSELSARTGREATLDDLTDAELNQLAAAGFEMVWLLGVWQTGREGRDVSLAHPGWREAFTRTLPDLRESDVCGSPFAIRDYHVHSGFGGDEALARLRRRLSRRGLRLMLDLVPNHTAFDHPWVSEHPEYYVYGSERQLGEEPRNYRRLRTGSGDRILAHGRDPYFPGWPDTVQLNYANPDLQEAMLSVLLGISRQCDALRCDMAMLVLPDIFERTWGLHAQPFWPGAIRAVRHHHPEFLFLAEVYWDREWELQQQGFDYTYDKRLYDRLRARDATLVRQHLTADLSFQSRLARFLENHDEPRAAAVFDPAVHQAAAIITYLTPGLRFFHQGQMEGRRVHVSVHLGRGPAEPVDSTIAGFYHRLLAEIGDPELREGGWELLSAQPAWEGNWSSASFIVFLRTGAEGSRRLVAVNYSDHPSQCFVPLRWPGLGSRDWRLQDQMGMACYDRSGADLAGRGLYLDLPPWGYHVFRVYPV